jgi:hypothetical protein
MVDHDGGEAELRCTQQSLRIESSVRYLAE